MTDATGHVSAYRDVFGPQFGLEPGCLPSRLVAVLFTNRCGSMLFTEMIGSSPDIITNYEVFNGDVVKTRSREWEVDSFPAYMTRIFGRPRVTYTAKIHAAQLGFLAEAGLLAAFAGGISFWRVRRRDQLAQAVSHSIARQTGRWTSFVGKEGEAGYDFAEIRDILTAIRREQVHLDDLTGRLGIEPRTVVFEEFVKAPSDFLVPAWHDLGVRPGRADLSRTRHRRQGTGRNRDFIRQFREDIALLKPATVL